MSKDKITTASTAEYFAKNLQMVGFSSPAKAVLTTIKEGVDNSLDACEENGILPEIKVIIEKIGPGLTTKGSDLIKITVQDNGPGIDPDFVPQVYGTFLASSKFGRGKCSRGVQGLGSSAVLAWAQSTTTQGVKVITKTSKMKKAYSCTIEADFKNNKGIVKHAKEIDSPFAHGTSIEFTLDGKVQVNGDAGVLAYLTGTALVNPALTLTYQLPGEEVVVIERVTDEVQRMPEAVEPHPHTMTFNEFNIHSGLHHGKKVRQFLKDGFSRMGEGNIQNLLKKGLDKKVLDTTVDKLDNKSKMALYQSLQDITLLPPSTKSVRQIGEENLSKSIHRLGNVDFFSVVTRPATICDHKPLQVEVAVARLANISGEIDSPVQVLRFANLVPLQFDKKACVTVQSIESVNWKAYGLQQSKDSLPTGPYIFAISIVSPFIKFKNASKESMDDSEEIHQEIRLALIQAGQKIAKFIKAEAKRDELEAKRLYIEQFSPILIKYLQRLTDCSTADKNSAEAGLKKILGREVTAAVDEVNVADKKLKKMKDNQ